MTVSQIKKSSALPLLMLIGGNDVARIFHLKWKNQNDL